MAEKAAFLEPGERPISFQVFFSQACIHESNSTCFQSDMYHACDTSTLFWEVSTPFQQGSLVQMSVCISISFSLSFVVRTVWASPQVKESKETENWGDQAVSGYARHSCCYADSVSFWWCEPIHLSKGQWWLSRHSSFPKPYCKNPSKAVIRRWCSWRPFSKNRWTIAIFDGYQVSVFHLSGSSKKNDHFPAATRYARKWVHWPKKSSKPIHKKL